MNRVIWIILDSVGAGDLPDSESFGDSGCHTIGHVWEKNGGLKIPNMLKMGLGNIDGMINLPKEKNPIAAYGKCAEISMGKDTTTGHWEMTGIYGKTPFPTYPDGFPERIINEFIVNCQKEGIKYKNSDGKLLSFDGVLGNCTASGTEIIKKLGEEHERTGKPIVYTSADSVFQIAANEELYPPETLYKMCQIAREILNGKDGVGRVIARPYVINGTERVRTANRRDFSLIPPRNLLNELNDKKITVAAVGKIEDIFAGSGITMAVHTKDNMDGVDKTLEYMDTVKSGLIFTNLVEFDSKWGHRNDYEGYGKGLEAVDARLTEIIKKMTADDILVINADHGCDPTTKGTDHTREYIPLLVYGRKIKPVDLGIKSTFADIGQTIGAYLGLEKNTLSVGKSFLGEIF